ncbi:beta-lactamase-like protein [Sordaria brevicollis]|uniref:Beta-lactamase-like protein n=1 Tax=Sordaria brevicollis TaxID=83679 RepID=A0AAE0P1N0_SORBR|nr:beta-lactamase-like protein [Sordaria brevicollis]
MSSATTAAGGKPPITPLPEVTRLSPSVIRILGGNPGKFTLQGTNTYLVGTGPARLLIDSGAGERSWISALQRTLSEEKAHLSAAIITHWHHDHTGGIRDLLDWNSQLKLYKNQPTYLPGHHGSPVCLDQIGGAQVLLPIEDGQEFHVEGATLKAVHTPGHTVDHMVLHLAEEDALFTGDNVLGHGTAVYEDLGTYLDSLECMRGLFKGKGYPGHGPVIEDGPGKIGEYISHRKQREDQVIETLKAFTAKEDPGEGWTPMELVKVIYQGVPETLHIPAAGGVVQILHKLRKEGKVTMADGGDRWRLIDRSAL